MKLLKRKGESLAETVIALFVISVGVAGGFMLVLNSLRTGMSISDRVEAINLAREGIEAVRTVRDSNWIKYAGDRRNYWNCADTETCGDEDKIEAGKKYAVDFDENLEWRLYEAPNNTLDLKDGLPNSCLGNTAEDCFFALAFKHCAGEKVGYYTNNKEAAVKLWDCEDEIITDEPRFFRQISFNYKDDPYTTDDENILEATVLVEWFDQNEAVKKIEMTTYLTDFLGRNNNSEE